MFASMKNYAKVGNRTGRVAYRTAAVFRYKQYLKIQKRKQRKHTKYA